MARQSDPSPQVQAGLLRVLDAAVRPRGFILITFDQPATAASLKNAAIESNIPHLDARTVLRAIGE